MRVTVSIDDEAQVAPRKPVTHDQRAHAADKGAGYHVTQVVRIEHDPADRNDQCIDEHEGAQPRPEQPDRNRRREGRRSRRSQGWRHGRLGRPLRLDPRWRVLGS